MSIYSEYEIKRCTNDFPLQPEASNSSVVLELSQEPSDQFQIIFDLCSKDRWEDVKKRYGKEELDRVVNAHGRSLLLEALDTKNIELAKQLIQRQISVDTVDTEQNTSLHYAARIGDLQLFRMISANQWNVTSNQDGKTPLHIAAETGNDVVVLELIQKGAPVNVTAKYKLRDEDQGDIRLTPLYVAIKEGHVACVDILMSAASNERVQSRTEYDIPVPQIGHSLHFAIHFQHLTIVELLLTKYWEQTKRLVEAKNSVHETPLMHAAIIGELGIMDFLIRSRKVSLDAIDDRGRTVLHRAVLETRKDVIDLLYHHISSLPNHLEYLNALDFDQRTPLALLAEKSDNASKNLMAYLRNLIQRPISHFPCPPLYGVPEYENLAIQGGGPPGIAYLGAAEAFERLGSAPRDFMRRIKRIAGTSAGAIYGGLMAFDYTADQMGKKLKEKDLTEFLDHDFLSMQTVISLLQKIYDGILTLQGFQTLKNLWAKGSKESWEKSPGFCKGENFREWMDKCIEEKTKIKHCTFGDLRRMIEREGRPFKHFHVFTASLETSEVLHINSEDEVWDNVIISDAIRASMSIPGMFRPHMLHIRNESGMRVAEPKYGLQMDGGLTCNFPVDAFDQRKYLTKCDPRTGEFHVVNSRTLGLSLYTPTLEHQERQQNLEKRSATKLFLDLISIYYNTEQATLKKVHENQFRTILISNQGVKLWEFDLSSEKQRKLQEGALGAVLAHFDKLRQVEKSANTSYIQAIRICGKLRSPLPTFHGRETYLKILAEKLLKNDKSIHKVMLLAPEGFGKTETAIFFANAHLSEFSVVKWIDGETPESRKQAYHELASDLGITWNGRDDLKTILQRVHRALAALPQNKPFLLIFDNVEEDIELPQTGNGSILITTKRDDVCKSAEVIEMPLFSREEALLALQKTTNRPSSVDMEQLAEELGRFPLAIGQLGTYISENNVVISDFTRNLREHSSKALDRIPSRFAYRSSLNSALKMTREMLQRPNYSEAYSWLKLCCFLESDRIPMEWIDRWLQRRSNIRDDFFDRKTAIISQLARFGIITCDMTSQMISIHRLNKTSILEGLTTDERAFDAQAACHLVLSIGMEFDTQHPCEWPALEIWEKHAKSVLKMPESKPEDKSKIHTILGLWAKERGDLKTATIELETALGIQESELKDREEKTSILNHLGGVYKLQGNAAKVMEQFEKISEMIIRPLPQASSNLEIESVKFLNHAGELNHTYGVTKDDLQSSLNQYETALEICEKKSGNIPLDLHAKILDNIGVFIFESRSLSAEERVFSSESRTLGDARKKHEAALRIYKALHSNGFHPTIAQNYEYQSLVLQALGFESAESMLQNALFMKQKLYGNRAHPSLVSVYRVAAIFYRKLNVNEAISYCNKALTMEETINPESLEMAQLCFLMGTLLRGKGERREQALEYLSKALLLFEKCLGPQHPKTSKAKARLERFKSMKYHNIKIIGMKFAKFVAAPAAMASVVAFAASKFKGLVDHNKNLTAKNATLAAEQTQLSSQLADQTKTIDVLKHELQYTREDLVKSQEALQTATRATVQSNNANTNANQLPSTPIQGSNDRVSTNPNINPAFSLTEVAITTAIVGVAAAGVCTIQ